MKSSVKINNRIDMSGKSVSFSIKEKANRIPVKSLDRRKFNMNKMAKNALGSIPSCVLVTGSSEQRAEMEILKMVQGSIHVVIGSLTKTELKKSGEKTMGIKDIDYVMYHDTTGVRTAAKAASGNKNSVLSNINKSERNGWVKTEIGWMYNENGKPVTGWKLIDGKWYYLYEDGHMAKSEKIQGKDGKVYDIDENGVCSNNSNSAEDELSRKIDDFINIALNERVENTGFVENQVKKKKRNKNGEIVEVIEGDNINRYGKWYGDNGVPWCAIYVSWCANEAGILNNRGIAGDAGKPVPKFESCQTGKSLYEEAQKYHNVDSGYEPKKGDLFIHLNRNKKGELDGTGHTGIVIAYNSADKTVYTVEGNSNDRVSVKKTHIYYTTKGHKYFDGFCSNGGTDYGVAPDRPLLRGGESDR